MTAPILPDGIERYEPVPVAAAEVTTYSELIAAIRSQVEGMNVRQLDFDKLAGFPQGLTGKAFGLLQVKRLGSEKLFDALRAAGLRLRVEIDPDQLAKMQARIERKLMHPRQENQARPGHSASLPSTAVLNRVMQPWRKIGGKKRWHKTTPEERSAHMRMMAMAGVRKRRKEMKKRARQRKRAHQARKEASLVLEQAGAVA